MATTAYQNGATPSRDAAGLTVRDIVACLEGQVCTYHGRESVPEPNPGNYYRDRVLEPGDSASYGDFEPCRTWDEEPDSELFFLPDVASGSDYSGCSVTLVNFETLRDMAAERELPAFEAHGGHGTYAIAVRFDCADQEFLEALAGLADYPSIDDEALCRKELELQDEAWESWAESDYLRALENDRSIEFEATDSAIVREVFERTAERIGEYWRIETGASAYVDVERVASATELSEFQAVRWTVDDPDADLETLPPCPHCSRELERSADAESIGDNRWTCRACRREYELRERGAR